MLPLVAGRWKRSDFHPSDQTILNSETMPNGFIGQYDSRQVAHDLMHFDQDLPGLFLAETNRFHMRTNFAPLLYPVGADFFRSVDEAAFERPRPLHVGSHEGQGGINVARVESRVGGTEQFGFCCRLVWHKNDLSGETLPRSEYPFALTLANKDGSNAAAKTTYCDALRASRN
jgi:hypothetical protein